MFFWIFFISFWVFVYLLHKLNADMFSRRGISVRFMQISYQFQSIPSWIAAFCDQWRLSLIRVWFNIGVVIGLLLMPISLYILIHNLVLSFIPASQPMLTLLVPGVNITFSHMIHVLVALGVNGVVHELGHAMAGMIDGISPKSFGVFVFIIYPGAYVDLGNQVSALSNRARIRIYTAGVWHNVVLALVAVLLLIGMPFILSPVFTSGQGAVITGVIPNSALDGPGGLHKGHIVTHIDECVVKTMRDWYDCLEAKLRAINSPDRRAGGAGHVGFKGHCLSPGKMAAKDVLWADAKCCINETLYNDLRCLIKAQGLMFKPDLACVHETVEQLGPPICANSGDCEGNEQCYFRVLPPSTSNSLLVLSLKSADPILFYGSPLVLSETITISDFWPHHLGPDNHGTKTAALIVQIPTILDTYLRFLISVSAAVALLNVVPIPMMDGDWLVRAIVDGLLSSRLGPSKRIIIVQGALALGSILLGLNVAVWLYSLFF